MPVPPPPPMPMKREVSPAMESRASLPEPTSPMPDVQHVTISSQQDDAHATSSQPEENLDSDGSDDDSEDDEELFANINMSALSQRGKGTYYCPKGLRCDKGGVDKDGALVLFDRNSSFAYVTHHDDYSKSSYVSARLTIQRRWS